MLTNKTDQQFTLKVIDLSKQLYGYEIYSDNKLLIRQINIPGVIGNEGFYRKIDAQKIGKLVLMKLSRSITVPVVEKHELYTLHIKY